MDIINLSDFSLIGYCIVDPVKGLLKLFLNVDIDIYKNKFIFLGIDSFYIPFKIIDVVDKKKTVYLVVEDFDILSKYCYKKINVYLPQREYNNIVKDIKNFDVTGFTVIDEDEVVYGKVCSVYDYPNNKCICVKKNSFEKIIPFNKHLVKIVNVNKKELVILKKFL